MEILLYDILEDRIIYPKTEFVSREDVNEYFLCEYNYAACGMVSRFDVKELDIDGKNYEVLVSDKISRSVYQTETYLCKGELVYCTPIYEKLQVEGTGLEKIVNDGILRVFRPDVGMYVYQYEGDLYWIADLKYEFDNNNSTYIQYQMNTTQIQKLPDDRLKNGWTWENEGFTFEDNEMELMGEWRVAKCSLPVEYSVTEIWTGYYMGEWVWKQSFRPYYIKD